MSNIRCPNSASAAPRFTAVVVLPTPPFCIATAIVRAKSAPSLADSGFPWGLSDQVAAGPFPRPLTMAAVFVVPLIAAVVGSAFATVVGRQYLSRRKPYQA